VSFNNNPNIQSLATLAGSNDDVRAKVWAKKIDMATTTADDFKMLEGPVGSNKPIWANTDLTAVPGQAVVINVLGAPGGPGARGESSLEGKESTFRIGAYRVPIEFWRDAVALTKSQIKKLAAGPKLKAMILQAVGEKLGRQKQRDMMLKLIRQARTGGNIVRPNNRVSLDTIVDTDVLSLDLLVSAKARLQTSGAMPISVQKDSNGSPVYRYMPFCTLNGLAAVRNSDSYQEAVQLAMERGLDNPLFPGKLVPWQNLAMFEHTVQLSADADDVQGSPLEPFALLGVAIAPGSATVAIRATSTTESDKTPFYFSDFPGYAWTQADEETAPDADTNSYYFWIINPPNAATDPGKGCFYKYTGSANSGTKITAITERLASADGAGGADIRKETIGSITWDASLHTQTHGVGSYIIPASAEGAPIGYSLVFGAGGAVRTYGELDANAIQAEWDYGFVKGFGYEACFGQGARLDTQGVPRHFMLIEHCIPREGITIPIPE